MPVSPLAHISGGFFHASSSSTIPCAAFGNPRLATKTVSLSEDNPTVWLAGVKSVVYAVRLRRMASSKMMLLRQPAISPLKIHWAKTFCRSLVTTDTMVIGLKYQGCWIAVLLGTKIVLEIRAGSFLYQRITLEIRMSTTSGTAWIWWALSPSGLSDTIFAGPAPQIYSGVLERLMSLTGGC